MEKEQNQNPKENENKEPVSEEKNQTGSQAIIHIPAPPDPPGPPDA